MIGKKEKRVNSMGNKIYRQLRNDILLDKIKPGTWLREQELSNRFGVSRMPVREALQRIERDGLVKHFPNRGTIVCPININNYDDIYDVRVFVESKIARHSAMNITESQLEELQAIINQLKEETEHQSIINLHHRFNEVLYSSSNNAILVETMHFLSNVSSVLVRLSYDNYLNPDRKEYSCTEHQILVDALKDRSPEKAEEAVIRHLNSSKEFFLNNIENKQRSTF